MKTKQPKYKIEFGIPKQDIQQATKRLKRSIAILGVVAGYLFLSAVCWLVNYVFINVGLEAPNPSVTLTYLTISFIVVAIIIPNFLIQAETKILRIKRGNKR